MFYPISKFEPCFFCETIDFWQNDRVFDKCLYMRSVKDATFFVTQGWEYGTNILEAFSFFVQCLIKLLHEPKRYVQGCKNYVLMGKQWFVENVFNTNIELLHGRSSISCPMIFSVVAVPQAKKTWVLGVTRLLPNRKFINFRWTQTIQLCSYVCSDPKQFSLLHISLSSLLND